MRRAWTIIWGFEGKLRCWMGHWEQNDEMWHHSRAVLAEGKPRRCGPMSPVTHGAAPARDALSCCAGWHRKSQKGLGWKGPHLLTCCLYSKICHSQKNLVGSAGADPGSFPAATTPKLGSSRLQDQGVPVLLSPHTKATKSLNSPSDPHGSQMMPLSPSPI